MKLLKPLISKHAVLILSETILTTLVSILDPNLGLILTYGLAIAHIYLEKK